MSQPLRLDRPGLIDYASAWQWQQVTANAVRAGGTEALALLEHEPVYTFGCRIRPEHMLVSPEALRAKGAGVVETNRGGSVTFHGPGQLVGYPILDLRRRGLGPSEYVRLLEETLIRALARFGVPSWLTSQRPGVWTREGKIGAIGVRIEDGVSLHGFALNVDVDLSWFDAIIPCGLEDAGVTSIAQIAGKSPCIEAVTGAVADEFASVFESMLLGGEYPSQPTDDPEGATSAPGVPFSAREAAHAR